MTGKHSNVHTQEPPLPIPPYLRTSSRHHSNSSVSSQHSTHSTHQSHQMQPPHPQQHEFVPTFDSEGLTGTALYERALFEDAVSHSSTPNANSRSSSRGAPFSASFFEENPTASLERHQDTSAGANFEHDLERTPTGTPTEASLLNWEAAREGSISRRPKWRRPSPKWVYPVIMGMALSLGMGSPPRSELYVNLACMAHPPTAEQKTVMSALIIIEEHDRTLRSKESEWVSTHDGDVGMHNSGGVVFIPVDQYPEQGIIDSNIVDAPHTNTTRRTDLSPADKWFIHLQHEIYEYRHRHSPHAGWSTEPGKGPAALGPDQSVGNGSDWNTGDGKGEDKGEDHSNREEGRTGGPFREIDPQLCKRDAKVQAAAAKLTMMLTLTMGFLSALTTGFWGSTSDKWGRTKIMTVVEVGLFLNELCFILVANFPHLAPGGYRSLLIGPTVEGLLGGFSTITATVNAYLSDITPDGSRVMAFSRAMGFMMAGFACGPVLGSILIQSTGDIMTPFYINLVLYSLSIPLVLFLLPESLSSDARLILAKRARLAEDADARREAAEIEWEDETPVLPRAGMNERGEHAQEEEDPLVSGRSLRLDGMSGHLKRRKMMETIKRLGKKATGFLAPLGIFLPMIVEEDEKEDEDGEGRVSGRVRREWNMTVMGMVIIKYVKSRLNPSHSRPKSAAHEAEAGGSAFTTSDHSLPSQSMSSHNSVYDRPSSSPPVIDNTHTGHLDLFTIRLCLFLELVPWFILSFGTSESAFIILTALTTFGSPATPAANSLALSLLPDPSQSGRLFGALSVVHALGATLISPLMFGMLFASTVEDYAAAVFALATAFVGGALVCMLCVRIPESGPGSFGKGKNTKDRDWVNDVDEFEREEEIRGRGRNRKVKRVMSMSVGDSASSLRSSYDGEVGVSSAA
ncbi:hypothetical protein I314_01819 [Cryptococcus bacillisporus CA1873]|uniref:Major facilitator superfamily (MFS) profile domain-containing protein n=1 Tax=Cryptococcus bacillisporus CA1873 TaxID=1296111 RepID=A0ABR5BGN8_CRYGA|nr:hypothetical protein I314_01819 [Cryptococcus bacillisporus CA1873]|eukprot:KIR68319.1 hypothetical protein I314_01819 [Cryptococcus gattii CA1873]